MRNRFYFADLLNVYVEQSGYTPGQLSKYSGIPKATIVNWREGRVRRPRSWRDLLKLADALRLSESDATKLLQSAGHPPIQELLTRAEASKKHAEIDLLSPWKIEAKSDQLMPPFLFDNIVQRRMEAEDWKQLHEDCQAITFKLFIVRGTIAGDNVAFALESLEWQWRLECSDLIKRFIRFEHLPDRPVRHEFIEANQHSKWLQKLQRNTLRLDRMIDMCITSVDLQIRMTDVRATLYGLERVCNELLKFLDDKLLRTLKELDKDIEEVRRHFV